MAAWSARLAHLKTVADETYNNMEMEVARINAAAGKSGKAAGGKSGGGAL